MAHVRRSRTRHLGMGLLVQQHPPALRTWIPNTQRDRERLLPFTTLEDASRCPRKPLGKKPESAQTPAASKTETSAEHHQPTRPNNQPGDPFSVGGDEELAWEDFGMVNVLPAAPRGTADQISPAPASVPRYTNPDQVSNSQHSSAAGCVSLD